MGKATRRHGTMKVGHTKLPGQPQADRGEMDWRNHGGVTPQQIQGGLNQTGDAYRYKAPPAPDLGSTPTNMRRSQAPRDLNKQPVGHSKGTAPGRDTKPY